MRVGKGGRRREDSHAGGRHFPWEPTITMPLGLQVHGREDNSKIHSVGTREKALGKAATAAWMTGRRAASGKLATEFQRGLLAMQKAAALKAPCDMWLNRRYCLYSKDQGTVQRRTCHASSECISCWSMWLQSSSSTNEVSKKTNWVIEDQ